MPFIEKECYNSTRWTELFQLEVRGRFKCVLQTQPQQRNEHWLHCWRLTAIYTAQFTALHLIQLSPVDVASYCLQNWNVDLRDRTPGGLFTCRCTGQFQSNYTPDCPNGNCILAFSTCINGIADSINEKIMETASDKPFLAILCSVNLADISDGNDFQTYNLLIDKADGKRQRVMCNVSRDA